MEKYIFRLATEADRDAIYRLRHEVYASELAQHRQNPQRMLRDPLDDFNQYIVAARDGRVTGFVSITPPGHDGYSIDKYLRRDELPFDCDDGLYEVRLLTVARPFRTTCLAGLLMYAAYRWVEAHGGRRIVAIGRREFLNMYLKAGFQVLGRRISSGAVTFELISAPVSHFRQRVHSRMNTVTKIGKKIHWRLEVPFLEPERCEHGGTFFKALGEDFDTLERRAEIINADVLDAWFPPAPEVLERLHENLEWLLRTSPPTHGEGMVRAIAASRGVPAECIVPAAGSSDLMFLALPRWLTPKSRVLLLDPTYGEYAHLFEQIIRCQVDRLFLDPADNYRIEPGRLESRLENRYDLVVLVNPNNPTGTYVARRELQSLLRRAPKATRFWIDETYIDYVDPQESLEPFAAESENVAVCKSMSKAYALSGVRAAYLCAPKPIAQDLLSVTPPWAVGLPAQLAAVTALKHLDYYQEKYEETRRLRTELIAGLRRLENITVYPGQANIILCRLPETGPAAAALIERCQAEGLFLRNISSMTSRPAPRSFRIAVKDAQTNAKMLQVIDQALREMYGDTLSK